jgi:hypothetical protein
MPASEIKIEGANSDPDAMVFVSSTEPSENAASDEHNQCDSPKPNQSQNYGRLNVTLDDSKWAQYVPQQLGHEKGHCAKDRKIDRDHAGQELQKTRL